MSAHPIDDYRRASTWAVAKASEASHTLDTPTTCDDWTVGELLSHLLETQRYFSAVAQGEDAQPPASTPPPLESDDPGADLWRLSENVAEAFQLPGVLERTGPLMSIALSDQLLHGWDLAKSTSQDAVMPRGLAQTALGAISGRITEAQRVGLFKSEVQVAENASAEDRLLAYAGRDPRWSATPPAPRTQ